MCSVDFDYQILKLTSQFYNDYPNKFVGKPIQAPPQIYSAFHFLRNAITPIQANIASPAANGR